MVVQKFKTVFNKQITDFFTAIIATFPEETVFNTLRAQISMALMLDDTIAIKHYHEYVTKLYKAKIYKKDVKFFLEFDLSGTPLEHLNQLKTLWKTADAKTQATMWQYIKVLTILSEKYYS